MSIADKLLQVNQVKQDIKTAIETKGIPMTNVAFTEYANKILDISGGGGITYEDYARTLFLALGSSGIFPNAWEHSLTVDPLEIIKNSTSANSRGTAQYPNGEIEGVIIPNSVTSIGTRAFSGWSKNNQPLVIPNSVTYIGTRAFTNWSSNNKLLIIPNSVTNIENFAFDQWSKNNQPLTIPNSLINIRDYAFSRWSLNNQPLVIPDSVTTIGNQAFWGWISAKEFIMESETPPTITISSFDNTNNAPIYVPDESVEAYKTATNWASLASRIFPISDK